MLQRAWEVSAATQGDSVFLEVWVSTMPFVQWSLIQSPAERILGFVVLAVLK